MVVHFFLFTLLLPFFVLWFSRFNLLLLIIFSWWLPTPQILLAQFRMLYLRLWPCCLEVNIQHNEEPWTKIPGLRNFKCEYIVVFILVRNYSIKCKFGLTILTFVIQRNVKGCGFFLWVDSSNDGEKLVSIVRRVQLLERNFLELRSKLDVMKRKVHVLETGSY